MAINQGVAELMQLLEATQTEVAATRADIVTLRADEYRER
jgi:hypothetical protein